jgi:hypothetical protein
MQRATRIVYLNAAGETPALGELRSGLRSGEAGCAWLDPDGAFELDTRVRISPNSTHALLGHGVVAELNTLPLEGKLGEGLEALIPPACLDTVRTLLFEADRKTYGAQYEFVVESCEEPERIEYRVKIDTREYQSTLSHLTFLMSVASREGLAAWIRI